MHMVNGHFSMSRTYLEYIFEVCNPKNSPYQADDLFFFQLIQMVLNTNSIVCSHNHYSNYINNNGEITIAIIPQLLKLSFVCPTESGRGQEIVVRR